MGILKKLINTFKEEEPEDIEESNHITETEEEPQHEKFKQITTDEINERIKQHDTKLIKRGEEPKKPNKKLRLHGKYKDFEKTLEEDSLIILLIGGRGSGKSCQGFRILENITAINKNRPCFVIGSNPDAFPSFIEPLEDMEDAPNNSIVLIDEGALEYNARESMGKKSVNLTKIMAIARHKNISLIYITQNTALGDKNVLRLCDALIFKDSSLMQEETERKEVKQFYEPIKPFFKSYPKKSRKPYSYVFSDDFCGFIKSGLPSFWTDEISKGYGDSEAEQYLNLIQQDEEED